MIEEALLKSNFNGKDGFIWWIGQIAKKTSWEKGSKFSNQGDWAARCKVRIVGYHSFDGNILADEDLPWAQVMLDPSFGSAQGGIGGTIDLKGGETCFGFFLDGDDAQQPVVIGLLYRSDGVKNLQTEDAINKERSSQFKPFTGHPGNIVPDTQRDSRAPKQIDPYATTADRNQVETSPLTPDQIKQSYNYNPSKGIIDSNNNPVQHGDKIAGVFEKNPAFSTNAVLGAFCQRPAFVTPNGCQNNLISQITQGLQDFIAFTNGLDKYLNVYINPVLNEVVDIANSISQCANQIIGIVKLIINNLRDTIFKCIIWLFKKLVALFVPPPQQKPMMEALKVILDKIFCILEKLNFLPFVQNLLGDLAKNTVNAPVCAVEQFTAGILAKVMEGIDTALADIISGINWLTNGIGKISKILNRANSLASQIFSFLECTGLACKTPHVWAANFGPSQKEADDWDKMVNNVNVFKGISQGLGSIEDAMYQTPLLAGIDGAFNNVYNQCNQIVSNPTNQNDIVPLPPGSKYSTCLPPIARIVGDGVGASAVPIVSSDSSIFSVEVISGGVGYTYASIVIVDNTKHGSGAQANAIIENGSITSIYLTNYGSGYCAGNYTTGIGTTSSAGIGTTSSSGTTKSINIASSKNSINEGDNFNVYATSNNIPDNTLIKYEITGISNKAISQSLTGNLVIKDNKSLITIDTFKDVIDDSKILTFSLPEYDKSVEIFVNKLNKPQTGKQQYYLTSSNSVITEGQSFVINLTTQNVENGTLVPYTITGISGGLLNNQALTGTFNVLNNQSKLNINTNQRTIKNNEIFKLTLDNKLSSVSVLIKPSINPKKPGISSDISGCVESIILVKPGYGYTVGDTITDGKNTYVPNVSPKSGAIVSIQPLTNPVCGFTAPPTLTINTRTGVGAQVVPLMKYYPTYVSVNQNLVNNQITRTGITTVIDCV